MIRVAWAQLRHRPGRYLALFFAVFAAVALAVAAGVLATAVRSGVEGLFTRPYENVQVVSTDPAAQTDLPHLREQTMRAAVQVEGSRYDWTQVTGTPEGPLQWRNLTEGRWPQTIDEVVLTGPSESVRSAGELALAVPAHDDPVQVQVVGRAEASAAEQLQGVQTVLAHPDAVTAWAGPDTRVTTELRVASPTPEATAAELGGTTTRAHTERLLGDYFQGRDKYFLLLYAFVAVVTVVAALVIYSTYLVIAGQRVREFALSRVIGASTRQLLAATVAEVALLGVLASALGAATGSRLAGLAVRAADSLDVRVPLGELSAPPWLLLAGVVGGVALTGLAALPAARRAATRPIVESLSAAQSAPHGSGWWSLLVLLGGLSLAAAGAVAAWQRPTGQPGLIVAVGGAGLVVLGALTVLAVAVPRVMRVAGVLVRPVPALQLGAAYTSRNPARAGALVAVVCAGTALVSAVWHGQEVISTDIAGRTSSDGFVDVTVTAADGSLDPGLQEAVTQLPGVAATAAPQSVAVEAGGRREAVLALEDPSVLRWDVDLLAPETIVLGRASPLLDALPDRSRGPVTLPGFGTLELNVRHGRSRQSFIDPSVVPALPEQLQRRPVLLVRAAGAADQPPTQSPLAGIEAAVSGLSAPHFLSEAFTARENLRLSSLRMVSISTVMMLVALAIAAVGLANTVALMIRERRRDHHLLRAIGLGGAGRSAVTGVELTALALPAALVGTWVGGVLGRWVASVSLDAPAWSWAIDPAAGGGIGLAALALTGLVGFAGMLFSRGNRSE